MKKKIINYDVPFNLLPSTMPHISKYEKLDGFIPYKGPSFPFPVIDKKSAFYKNCKRQRKLEAKICQDCPFRKGIEEQE